jgi:hypothetical protein
MHVEIKDHSSDPFFVSVFESDGYVHITIGEGSENMEFALYPVQARLLASVLCEAAELVQS